MSMIYGEWGSVGAAKEARSVCFESRRRGGREGEDERRGISKARR